MGLGEKAELGLGEKAELGLGEKAGPEPTALRRSLRSPRVQPVLAAPAIPGAQVPWGRRPVLLARPARLGSGEKERERRSWEPSEQPPGLAGLLRLTGPEWLA